MEAQGIDKAQIQREVEVDHLLLLDTVSCPFLQAEMVRMTEMRLNAEQEADEDDEEDSTDELS